MKFLPFCSFLLWLCLSPLPAWADENSLVENEPLSDPLVQSNNEFATKLLRAITTPQADPKENLCFSPYSIFSVALAASEGAVGETRSQMREVLQLPESFNASPASFLERINKQAFQSDDEAKESMLKAEITKLRKEMEQVDVEIAKEKEAAHSFSHVTGLKRLGLENELNRRLRQLDGPDCSVANALWLADEFPASPQYRASLARFGVGTFSCDFPNRAAAEATRINDWVSETTKGRIKELFSPSAITPDTSLVLTNAVYFRANWLNPFEKKGTRQEEFELSSGTRVQVPMMVQSLECRYAAFDANGELFRTPSNLPTDGQESSGYPALGGGQLIELPYSGTDIMMILLLPRSHDGLQELCERLTADRISDWVSGLDERRTNVLIPRFRLETSYELTSPLRQMGMPIAFSDAADFSGMTSGNANGVKIGSVVHKSFVEVNEEGTEAAAATGMTFQLHSGHAHSSFTPTFNADHPFLFLIRDSKSGMILFVGRVEHPSQG
ncbi:serpin family protein [Rhodopirellula sp. SWK7]|uniref:serpin family protein n=1 Tax=Rhodopirellula sp. SWK7 TaxID=595460 RepID=UPI001360B1DD|nr:serpin family protein [Rhodopirellula sp. SWK7]